MIPNKRENIYPFNKENVRAILNHFFNLPHGDSDWIYEINELEINQLEWIASKVADNISFFENQGIGESGRTVSNFMKYGIEACFHHPSTYRGSKNRVQITNNLRKLLLDE